MRLLQLEHCSSLGESPKYRYKVNYPILLCNDPVGHSNVFPF
jgi:hypothetical protein